MWKEVIYLVFFPTQLFCLNNGFYNWFWGWQHGSNYTMDMFKWAPIYCPPRFADRQGVFLKKKKKGVV